MIFNVERINFRQKKETTIAMTVASSVDIDSVTLKTEAQSMYLLTIKKIIIRGIKIKDNIAYVVLTFLCAFSKST